jgi:hypothetical protein
MSLFGLGGHGGEVPYFDCIVCRSTDKHVILKLKTIDPVIVCSERIDTIRMRGLSARAQAFAMQ